jgi:hypothetical protein
MIAIGINEERAKRQTTRQYISLSQRLLYPLKSRPIKQRLSFSHIFKVPTKVHFLSNLVKFESSVIPENEILFQLLRMS